MSCIVSGIEPVRKDPLRFSSCLIKRAFFLLLTCLFVVAGSLHAADPFEDVIRKTDPLTPEQEVKAFHLPPGFEAQLVACEPAIGKPMNMAFDAAGRLWITQSR